MKFKIRFVDQIIGFFIILSLASLVFVIVMLGRSQRWFAKDASYSTILPSAGGLNKNMAIQYRGFTIGNVKNFYLTDTDEVEVIFSIHEEYADRVKSGSLVEMMISPVGLGNQFLFHAGRGNALEAGAFVPAVGSAQARELIRQGLAIDLQHDDSISLLLNRASSVLAQLEEAMGVGTDTTEIGKIVGSLQKGTEEFPQLVATVNVLLNDIQRDLSPILVNLNAIITELNDPNNLLYTVLDTDEAVYINLVKSLKSLSGVLENLDKTVAFVPSQLPQISGLLMDLRVTIKTAEDVLIALTNNPLLRRGIPNKPDSQPAGTSPREIRF